jgi:asparagine synthase (glutamine-hydrolysing)
MCGIVGVIAEPDRVSNNQLIDMRDSISHRGPDDAGIWRSPCGIAMLGSRRLSILDLSASGHQPMEDEASGLVIAFNGEIYNYVELAEELAAAGYRFRSRSDTEVLLKSYEKWGESCLQRLNGMFAFAIWDESRQELFAARDRFGEKPFYFYLDENKDLFAFGSEIKALIAGRFFVPRPDPGAVYDFVANHSLDAGSKTMFENVAALPMASALRFSWRDRRLKVWRYWDLDGELDIRFSDDRQYAERFLELLSDSVRLRLRSDVPVGSSLSGGLDSSTIVGLVANKSPQAGQQTFSARFDDEKFDEGPHIQKMIGRTGIPNDSTYPNPRNLPREMESLTWHQDAPFNSSSIYAQWCVMRLAHDSGVKVLLDGQGGDETLAGYHSYFSAHFADLLNRFRFLKAAADLRRYSNVHGNGHLPLIFSGLLPAGLRSSAKEWLRPLAIGRDFERKFGHAPRSTKKKFRHPLHQSLYDTLTQSSLPQLLRYADRNSMAFSVEVRLPFLDHRLVEYLLAIPAEQKIDGVTTKAVLRKAMSGILPEEIRTRKDKLGFAPPESVWLRGPLREWVEDIFSSAQFRQRDWIDVFALDRVWSRFKDGETALHGVLWRWLSLETWVRTCLAPKAIVPCAQVAVSRDPAKSAYA